MFLVCPETRQTCNGRPITNFTLRRVFNFAWTKDSKHLLLAKGDVTTDVVLICNFQ
jgi:hypothetical protein